MTTAPATAREAMSARAMKPLSEVGSVPPLDSSAGFDSGLDSSAGAEEPSSITDLGLRTSTSETMTHEPPSAVEARYSTRT